MFKKKYGEIFGGATAICERKKFDANNKGKTREILNR